MNKPLQHETFKLHKIKITQIIHNETKHLETTQNYTKMKQSPVHYIFRKRKIYRTKQTVIKAHTHKITNIKIPQNQNNPNHTQQNKTSRNHTKLNQNEPITSTLI